MKKAINQFPQKKFKEDVRRILDRDIPDETEKIRSMLKSKKWKDEIEKMNLPRKIKYTSPGIFFLSEKYSLCNSCYKKTSSVNEFYNIHVCYDCSRADDKYKLITKTTAKKEYFLTDKHLSTLQNTTRANPHYKCASEMVLFLLDDIVDLAEKIHGEGGIEKKEKEREHRRLKRIAIKEATERSMEEKEKGEEKIIKIQFDELCDHYRRKGIDDNVIRNFNRNSKYLKQCLFNVDLFLESLDKHFKGITSEKARRWLIIEALELKGLKLRSDSRLCEMYIDGDNDWTVKEIVDEMARMRYLYEYTNYQKTFSKEFNKRVEMLSCYNGYYSGIKKDAREEIEDDIKDRFKVPKVWPWLR